MRFIKSVGTKIGHACTLLLLFYRGHIVLYLKCFHMAHTAFYLPVGQQGVCQRTVGWAAAGINLLAQS